MLAIVPTEILHKNLKIRSTNNATSKNNRSQIKQ